MSNLTKNQMINYMKNVKRGLDICANALTTQLNLVRDHIFMESMKICNHHLSNIDQNHFVPNEGLNGRSIYKQKLIIKAITELVSEFDKTNQIITDTIHSLLAHMDEFIENNKYYFPDDELKKEKDEMD